MSPQSDVLGKILDEFFGRRFAPKLSEIGQPLPKWWDQISKINFSVTTDTGLMTIIPSNAMLLVVFYAMMVADLQSDVHNKAHFQSYS